MRWMSYNLEAFLALVALLLRAAFGKKKKHGDDEQNKNHHRCAFFVHARLLSLARVKFELDKVV